MKVHFTDSEASQAAGREFLKRFLRRTENRDPEVNEKVAPAQIEAIGKWGVQREGSYEYLKTILQPTLVINGDNHVIIYSINSWILQQNIPNAQLIYVGDQNRRIFLRSAKPVAARVEREHQWPAETVLSKGHRLVGALASRSEQSGSSAKRTTT